jgi:hypothetical protein
MFSSGGFFVLKSNRARALIFSRPKEVFSINGCSDGCAIFDP